MKVIIAETYDNMCRQALDDLIDATKDVPEPLICVTSGDSPKGVYHQLTALANNGSPDITRWKIISLDEWKDMDANDAGSCGWHLNQQLFNRLSVQPALVHLFNGKAADTNAECQLVENIISKAGGINVAFVGLGLNGHVGMNEPGSAADTRIRIADIAAETQATGQKYFTEPKTLTHGITLGIANLMEAKKVILLVNGKHKGAIVKQVLQAEISEQIPATFLRNHPDCTIYLDQAAASLI